MNIRGQSTTEYMLIIAMLAVGLLVGAYAFVPEFAWGMNEMTGDSTAMFGAGTQNGNNDKR